MKNENPCSNPNCTVCYPDTVLIVEEETRCKICDMQGCNSCYDHTKPPDDDWEYKEGCTCDQCVEERVKKEKREIEEKPKPKYKADWETINSENRDYISEQTSRMKLPNGWLIKYETWSHPEDEGFASNLSVSTVFYPDSLHDWIIE